MILTLDKHRNRGAFLFNDDTYCRYAMENTVNYYHIGNKFTENHLDIKSERYSTIPST